IEARVKGRVYSSGLVFRENRGKFLDSAQLRLNVHLNYFTETKSLCVRPGSSAIVNDQQYAVTGVVNFGEEKNIGLILESEQVTIEQVRRIVNPRIRKTLDNYEASRPFNARTILFASMGKREEPALI